MKLYLRLPLLMCGALFLMSCASYQSEVEQNAAAPTGAEKQVVVDGSLDKLASAEDKPERRDDEIVCKKEVKLGSKLPAKKICATRQQWSDHTKAPREQWRNAIASSPYSS